jgi:hypothetical protein
VQCGGVYRRKGGGGAESDAEGTRAAARQAAQEMRGRRRDGRCKARGRRGRKRTSRRRGGVWEAEGGKTEKTSGGARTRKIYDMWPPWIFLSPVDPTLRVQTSVDCVGVVYQGHCQNCICTPVEPMIRYMNAPVERHKQQLIFRSDL